MKKWGFFVVVTVLLMFYITGTKAQDTGTQPVSLKTFIEKEYLWDTISDSWIISALLHYDYDRQGNLLEILKKDINSGQFLSKIEYYYSPDNDLSAYEVSQWADSLWIPATRYSYFYSGKNEDSQLVQGWNGTDWINKSLDTLYIYDSNDLLQQSENLRWKKGAWIPDHTVYYEYGHNGKLSLKYSTSPEGSYLSQVIYNYDAFDRLIEMYARFFRNGEWQNGWRRTYFYDACGNLKVVERQSWVNGSWLNTTMSEYLKRLHYNTDRGKVLICHKGHTIYVSVHAVEAHLRHGDCLGCCQGNDCNAEPGFYPHETKAAYTIYPNPARERVTIAATDPDVRIKRIDIINMNGSLVGSFGGNDASEIIVERGNIRPGNYLLRITGDTTEYLKLTFK